MDKAHKATDKRIASMEAHLRAIYTRADKEVREAWDKYMQTAEEELKPLQKAYEDAKKSGDKENIRKTGRILAAKKREMTITNAHYKAVVERTAQELTHVNEIATAYVNGELPDVYALNYNFVATGMQEVSGISFDLYDAHTVRNLAMSDETLLPYKVVDVAKDVKWNTKLINSEVLQGILQGESMSDIAARLTHVENMAANAAIRNARTMVTSAENKGRIDMMDDAEKQGIIALKRWISTHDARTRDWHAELDGQMQEKDKPFENSVGKIMYPGDPSADPANIYSCRCAIGYKVTGFKKAQVQKDMAEKQVEQPKTQGWESLPDNVTDRATEIDKLLTEETGKKSVFNGKVVVDDSIKFNGTANYDGSITLRSNASRKTEIHELLHQHSEGGQNKVYVSIFKNIEEGSVELLAQEICHAKGIKIGQFDYSYTPYVDALRQINKLSGAYKTDYDFAKAVFGKPLEKRAEFLKSLGDSVAKDEKRFFRGALKTLGVK